MHVVPRREQYGTYGESSHGPEHPRDTRHLGGGRRRCPDSAACGQHLSLHFEQSGRDRGEAMGGQGLD
jgi:hypothetical protein